MPFRTEHAVKKHPGTIESTKTVLYGLAAAALVTLGVVVLQSTNIPVVDI